MAGGLSISSHLAAGSLPEYFLGRRAAIFQLQKAGKFCDLRLMTSQGSVRMHRAVLLPLAPSLAPHLVTNCGGCEDPTIYLTETSLEDLVAAVHLIYCGWCRISSEAELHSVMSVLEGLAIPVNQHHFSTEVSQSVSLAQIEMDDEDRDGFESRATTTSSSAAQPPSVVHRPIPLMPRHPATPVDPNLQPQSEDVSYSRLSIRYIEAERRSSGPGSGLLFSDSASVQERSGYQRFSQLLCLPGRQSDQGAAAAAGGGVFRQENNHHWLTNQMSKSASQTAFNTTELFTASTPLIQASSRPLPYPPGLQEPPLTDKPDRVDHLEVDVEGEEEEEVVPSRGGDMDSEAWRLVEQQKEEGSVDTPPEDQQQQPHSATDLNENTNAQLFDAYDSSAFSMFMRTNRDSQESEGFNGMLSTSMVALNQTNEPVSPDSGPIDQDVDMDRGEQLLTGPGTTPGRAGKTGAVCQLCGEQALSECKLKLHYLNKHLYRAVSARFSSKDRICPLCAKNHDQKSNLVHHYAIYHNLIYNFVDVELQKRSDNNNSSSLTVLQAAGPRQPPAIDHRRATNINNNNSQLCGVCGALMIGCQRDTHIHLYWIHFSQNIKHQLGNYGTLCQLCGRNFASLDEVAFHIGVDHEYCDVYLHNYLDAAAKGVAATAAAAANKPTASSPSASMVDGGRVGVAVFNNSVACPFCGELLETRLSAFYLHCSTRHFAAELAADYAEAIAADDETGRCLMCGLTGVVRGSHWFLVHMGLKHDKVVGYLPPTLRLDSLENDLDPEGADVGHRSAAPLSSVQVTNNNELLRNRQQVLADPNLRSHHNHHHHQQQPTRCCTCHQRFPNMSLLLRHCARAHFWAGLLQEESGEDTPAWCPDCSRSFASMDELVMHKATVHLSVIKYMKKDPAFQRYYKVLDDMFTTNRADSNTTTAGGGFPAGPDPAVGGVGVLPSRLACPVCHCDHPTDLLLSHMVDAHFFPQLKMAMYGQYKAGGRSRCPHCPELLATHKLYLFHRAIVHHEIFTVLPVHLTAFVRSLLYPPPGHGSFSSAVIPPKQKRKYRSSRVSQMYKCQICPFERSGYKVFLAHLSTSHFRKKLRLEYEEQMRDGVELKCRICDKLMSKETFIPHMGSVHKEVVKYVDWLQHSDKQKTAPDSNANPSSKETKEAKKMTAHKKKSLALNKSTKKMKHSEKKKTAIAADSEPGGATENLTAVGKTLRPRAAATAAADTNNNPPDPRPGKTSGSAKSVPAATGGELGLAHHEPRDEISQETSSAENMSDGDSDTENGGQIRSSRRLKRSAPIRYIV